MKTFSVAAVIRATPEKIWALLTEASAYPDWNPAVTEVEGKLQLEKPSRCM